MLKSLVVRIVGFSARHNWLMTIAGVVLMVLSATYDVVHFSITTDVEALISQSLLGRARWRIFCPTYRKKKSESKGPLSWRPISFLGAHAP
ncbi:hypothetical protein [Bradyrhizobium sp.]|jgi:hypothetical protein|uniref:hypothetical protein n=1 Tax=Bradyrhizobium sp. TaxID=376 RepID=UPI003C1379C1